MPWKDTCALNERMRFVMEYDLGEESMAALCRAYGVSRKTGYKWIGRFAESGPLGLDDLPRTPHRHSNEVSEQVVQAILGGRRAHPNWGPKKLRVILLRKDGNIRWPAASTIGEILKRHGLTGRRKRRHRTPPHTQPFGACDGPNAIWCADFKGWFRTSDGRRCDPLTITDGYSRYLLRCQAMSKTDGLSVRPLFEAAFRQYGLPAAIRTDNGAPFASRGILGLSRLSVWWIKLGIRPERIKPGHPEQNGRHERMHLTLKQETACPPAKNHRRQQELFDAFRAEFNQERPHEALEMRTPSDVYAPSCRCCPERVDDFSYSELITRRVQDRGEFMWRHHKVFLSKVLWGELIGFEPLDGRYWRVHLGPLHLGLFDSNRFQMLRKLQARRVSRQLASLMEGPSATLQALPSGTKPHKSVTYVPG